MAAQLRPNERYALIGKTRSGKTALAMVLGGTFARALPAPWEVWWIDTKGDRDDLKNLRRWGFRNAVSDSDRNTPGAQVNAIYFCIDTRDKDLGDLDTVTQVQGLLREAYNRGNVIVIVDEYVQAVPSPKNAGKPLLDIFQRGGGLNVGIIGLTQEPVYVPRQLLSQATHQVLLTLTHGYDIEYLKKMEPLYRPPIKLGDPYGFWWKHVDGTGEVDYFPNQAVWYNQLQVALPKPPEPVTTDAVA